MLGIVYGECPHLFATVPYFRVQIPEVPAVLVAVALAAVLGVVVQRMVVAARVVAQRMVVGISAVLA